MRERLQFEKFNSVAVTNDQQQRFHARAVLNPGCERGSVGAGGSVKNFRKVSNSNIEVACHPVSQCQGEEVRGKEANGVISNIRATPSNRMEEFLGDESANYVRCVIKYEKWRWLFRRWSLFLLAFPPSEVLDP